MLITRRRAALGCVALQPVLLALLTAPAAAATVAGGASHTLVVRTTDATVWAFGLNSDGQLGDNTTTQRKTPIQVSGLSSVVAVAAGAKHSLALTSAGVLYAWGRQLLRADRQRQQHRPEAPRPGDDGRRPDRRRRLPLDRPEDRRDRPRRGERTTRASWPTAGPRTATLPTRSRGLGLVNAIAGGGNHTLVVLAVGGSMKAWGKNTNGQLGDGSTYARATSPVAVSGVLNATSAAGGYAFSFARLFDGTLYGWGHNSNGQLGFGDTTQRPTPTPLTTPTAVAAVATGGYHALALLSDGSRGGLGSQHLRQRGRRLGNAADEPGRRAGPVVRRGHRGGPVSQRRGDEHGRGLDVGLQQLGAARRRDDRQSALAGQDRRGRLQLEGGHARRFSPVPGTYAANQNVDDLLRDDGRDDPVHDRRHRSDLLVVPVLVGGPDHGLDDAEGAGLQVAGLADSTIGDRRLHPEGRDAELQPGGRHVHHGADGHDDASATTGATIRYTTDGTDPTEASTRVRRRPSASPTTTTLKAAGFKAGWTTSDIRTATYTMNFGTLAAPTFSSCARPATSTRSRSRSAAAAGATIRYTTNGATPSTELRRSTSSRSA